LIYGKYIYGIIIGSADITLGVRGVGGASLMYAIAHQDLGCVVSNYFGKEFSSMSKEELAPCLLAHQVVVEQVMTKHTVLPVKFGTILATSDEVCELLSQGYSQFFFTLVWIQDKVEVDVVAAWDRGQVLPEFGTEPEIVPAKKAIASKPEQQTQPERIHQGQMGKASMDRRRDDYWERIISFLKPVSIEVQPNPLVSDDMVINVAFLVERANLEAFDNRVRQLNDLFYNQINFRIIGPLPPYSFTTVEVTRPSPEKIEEARQLLGLGEVISELEVKKAYRHLAAETHPDRRPGDKLAKTRLAELRRASDLLVAYCQGQAESGGSFLINIRRSRSDEVQPSRLVEVGA
jgi:hypothetical protein